MRTAGAGAEGVEPAGRRRGGPGPGPHGGGLGAENGNLEEWMT